jgi:hypothetical protein
MAFSMHFLKRRPFERMLRYLLLCCFVTLHTVGQAQPAIELSQFDIERSSEELSITGLLQFELSTSVEDALLKGLPIYFRADVDILKERWYWYDKSQVTASRHYKLAYQPLTRRWRLSIGTGTGTSAGQGLALNQSFENLPQAVAAIKRITKWRVAGPGELDQTSRYRLEFRFQLDVSQLPRPFQIGVLGQSDWDISLTKSVILFPENLR